MQLLFFHPCLDLSFLLTIPKGWQNKTLKNSTKAGSLAVKEQEKPGAGTRGQAEQCTAETLAVHKDPHKIWAHSASLLDFTRWEPSRAAAWKLWQKLRAADKAFREQWKPQTPLRIITKNRSLLIFPATNIVSKGPLLYSVLWKKMFMEANNVTIPLHLEDLRSKEHREQWNMHCSYFCCTTE